MQTRSLIKKQLTPWLFMAPALILFAVFIAYPIIQSLILSFYDWDGMGPQTWVAWSNYRELWQDERFWISLRNNFYWLVCFMVAPVLGLLLALFLNQKVWGMKAIKSLFFFPFVISQVVVGLVFSWFYDPSYGLLNTLLAPLGFEPIAVLADESLVTFGIIAAGLWPQTAYCMMIYLAGLSGLSQSQIEAARIDRASGFRLFWHIILPQLRPATFLAVVVTVIGALRSFDLLAIMTDGGPYGQSSVLAYFMYEQSIFNFRMGYGSAIATVLFMLMNVYIAFFLWRMLRNETH